MDDLLGKAIPLLTSIRGILLNIAEFIAKAGNFNVDNVYNVVLILISLWIGKKIFNIWYTTSEGRGVYLIVIAGILFYGLKYFGV